MSNFEEKFGGLSDEELSKKILEDDVRRHLEDFPNPYREQCPSNELLNSIAVSGKLPDDKLRGHLLNCSPCLQEFHKARDIKVSAAEIIVEKNEFTAKNHFFRDKVFFRLVPAAALLLLIFGFIGWLIFKHSNESKIETAQETNRQVKNESSENVAEKREINKSEDKITTENGNLSGEKETVKENSADKSKTLKTKPSPEKTPFETARNTFNLDLSETAVLRNEKREETIQNLPAENVNINLKLVKNSPVGNYEVSVLDEFGKSLIKNTRKKSSGKYLAFNLDLRKISGRARLCVAPVGEIPDCFAVNIE